MKKTKEFMSSRDGNFAILSAVLLVPLMIAAGAAVDNIRASQVKTALQSAADSAILSAAANYAKAPKNSNTTDASAKWLNANGTGSSARITGPTIDQATGDLCIEVAEDVPTTLMRVAGINKVEVGVRSCASIPGFAQAEISLVVDVSSSMEEDKRFIPMQKAVAEFLDTVSADGNNKNALISIVPFSSRVSIGMTKTSWLRAYDGKPAIPARWSNPQATYDSDDYELSRWLDNKTYVAANSKNNYWMGCIEPRSDVSMKDTGKVSAASLSEDPPQSALFVPMDTNPRSSKSFCPPPITPLTNDLAYLKKVVSDLTPEGSTRLDAGIIAGWYSLSPKWRANWGGQAPKDYGQETKKILIFMTDGKMNTKYGEDEKDGLDWLCLNARSTACHDIATQNFLTTCESIKKAGIEIFTISYSNDADINNLKKCASTKDNALAASTGTIGNIYQQISQAIVGGGIRITR